MVACEASTATTQATERPYQINLKLSVGAIAVSPLDLHRKPVSVLDDFLKSVEILNSGHPLPRYAADLKAKHTGSIR
jgi:hypothetical protein